MGNDDGWAEWSKHVLIELERLNTKVDTIGTNISHLEKMKVDTNELKIWREKIDSGLSISEFKEIKNWKQRMEEQMSTTQLATYIKEHNGLKTFKTQAMMIWIVVQTLMAIAIFWNQIFGG